MNAEIFSNLATVFWTYFSANGLLLSSQIVTEEALKILKFMNIDYSKSKKALLFSYDGMEFSKKWSDIDPSKCPSKITPLKLSSMDIEDIEKILNSDLYIDFTHLLCPLFDAIGYVLVKVSPTYHLEFGDSELFEAWKEFYASADGLGLDGIWKRAVTEDLSSPMNWLSLKDVT